MKKFLFFILFYLVACTPKEESIVGKDYHLIHPTQPITITLKLDTDGRFYGKAVNNYFGVYQINGQEINLNLQGQTMMMGPVSHMSAEAKYLKSLRSINTFELNNNTLILKGNQKYIFKTSNTN